jgi:hypothetical protein
MTLYMLDGTDVKIMSTKESTEMIVYYFVVDTFALAER